MILYILQMNELNIAILIRDAKERIFHRYPFSIPAYDDLIKADQEVQIIAAEQKQTSTEEPEPKPVKESHPFVSGRDYYRNRGADRDPRRRGRLPS